jgi:GDPmannose 4,6-dehydratase
VDLLVADPGKAQRELEWKAETRFPALVQMMVEADLARHTPRR